MDQGSQHPVGYSEALRGLLGHRRMRDAMAKLVGRSVVAPHVDLQEREPQGEVGRAPLGLEPSREIQEVSGDHGAGVELLEQRQDQQEDLLAFAGVGPRAKLVEDHQRAHPSVFEQVADPQ